MASRHGKGWMISIGSHCVDQVANVPFLLGRSHFKHPKQHTFTSTLYHQPWPRDEKATPPVATQVTTFFDWETARELPSNSLKWFGPFTAMVQSWWIHKSCNRGVDVPIEVTAMDSTSTGSCNFCNRDHDLPGPTAARCELYAANAARCELRNWEVNWINNASNLQLLVMQFFAWLEV